jgi:hypothetical protein
MMMKNGWGVWVFIAILACGASSSFAAYTIDGSLSDWGVTPFTDWVPTPGVAYEQTDNVNKYNVGQYSEAYDFEALYLAQDTDHYYIGLVSSYPFRPLQYTGNWPNLWEGGDGGDIFLDVTGDMQVSPHGVVSGLDYVIQVASTQLPGGIRTGTWRDTHLVDNKGGSGFWPGEGWQGSPYQLDLTQPSTLVGWASVAIAVQDYAGEDNTYIVEMAVPKSVLSGDILGVHVSTWCGNDSINLQIPAAPAPGALLLVGLGTSLVGWIRSRKMQ